MAPRPYHDEPLHNWFCRLAEAHCLTPKKLLKSLNAHGVNIGEAEINGTCSAITLQRLEKVCWMESGRLKKLRVTGTWVLSESVEKGTCPCCYGEDIISKRAPFVRRLWRSPLYLICEKHMTPIITGNDFCGERVFSLLPFLGDTTCTIYRTLLGVQQAVSGQGEYFKCPNGFSIYSDVMATLHAGVVGQDIDFRKKMSLFQCINNIGEHETDVLFSCQRRLSLDSSSLSPFQLIPSLNYRRALFYGAAWILYLFGTKRWRKLEEEVAEPILAHVDVRSQKWRSWNLEGIMRKLIPAFDGLNVS